MFVQRLSKNVVQQLFYKALGQSTLHSASTPTFYYMECSPCWVAQMRWQCSGRMSCGVTMQHSSLGFSVKYSMNSQCVTLQAAESIAGKSQL